jgi:tRNA (cytidine56-2'-O)-methyltransferase
MITLLRLGHRRKRDARVSTHCGLASRAFGAQRMIFSGEQDEKLLESLRSATEAWGGPFSVSYEKNWKKVIRNFKGAKVHLTFYGLPLQDVIGKIRKQRDVLLIVGSQKVPGEVYGLADYNVAVTSQPHSEVSALAIFLHEYFQGRELGKKFRGAKLRIMPSERGKDVRRLLRTSQSQR